MPFAVYDLVKNTLQGFAAPLPNPWLDGKAEIEQDSKYLWASCKFKYLPKQRRTHMSSSHGYRLVGMDLSKKFAFGNSEISEQLRTKRVNKLCRIEI